MKKTIILLAVSITAILATGCRNSNKGFLIDSVKWETVTYEDNVMPSDTSYGTMSIRFDVDFPVSGLSKNSMALLTSEIIAFCIDETLTDMEPDRAMNVAADSLKKDYLETAEDMIASGVLHENMLRWSYEVNASQLRVTGNILTYFAYISSYSGGAHGIYSDLYLNVDLKTGQALSLSNIFVDPSSEKLSSIITAKAVKDERTFDDLSITGNAKVAPSSQFEITNDGVIFYYEPYQIGSYAAGVIDIKFNYDELKGFINPDFFEKYNIIAADPNSTPDAVSSSFVK